MAYGQTASGKSHTMGILEGSDLTTRREAPMDQSHNTGLGVLASKHQRTETEGVASSIGSTVGDQTTPGVDTRDTDPGIIPRALSRVFEHMGSTPAASTSDVSVRISLLQIYNETVQVGLYKRTKNAPKQHSFSLQLMGAQKFVPFAG